MEEIITQIEAPAPLTDEQLNALLAQGVTVTDDAAEPTDAEKVLN